METKAKIACGGRRLASLIIRQNINAKGKENKAKVLQFPGASTHVETPAVAAA